MNLHDDRGRAQIFDRFGDVHFAAIQLDAVLRLGRVGDVLGGHGPEQLAALAGFRRHFHFDFRQLRRQQLRFFQLPLLPVGCRRLLLLELVQGVGRRRRRQFFRQQKVAGVAFGHLQDFAFFPEFFYFLQ